MHPQFKAIADHAVLVTFGDTINEETGKMVVAADQAILAAKIPGIMELTPALVNLLVIFDPLLTDHASVTQAVAALFPLSATGQTAQATHEVAVCYDAPLCPDLASVAAACGISQDAVIAAHLAGDYRVGMYGFAPGFAYLAGVPDAIQVPRKTTPVRGIPKGSVMIAGPQCLCTTVVMPTGWSIIGRTNAAIMRDDPHKPFLFEIGDHVRFKRVTRDALGPIAQSADG